MASSKSYDLYLGLCLLVILFSHVCSHTLPEAEATNPGRKMILDGRISIEDFMRAIHFLESRTIGFVPAQTEYDTVHGDKMTLSGLSFFGFHGALPEERTLGQKFFVDIDAWVDLKPSAKSDNLSDTVDYTKIYAVTKEIVEGPPYNLVESVVQKIAITVLTNHQQISAVRVKVGKPHVAIQGILDYSSVEIIRRRSDLPEST